LVFELANLRNLFCRTTEETIEFIRLINTGTEKVCFDGWVLDDVQDGGSKPFSIRGGSVAPGGVRTFFKDETNLALNNSNDCAMLINQNNEVTDQICYGKTHKNEIFTHNGGDWVPKTSTKTTSTKNIRHTFSREPVSYKYEFTSESAIGKVELIYGDGELIYLTLDDDSLIQISYAGSSVDMGIAKQLIDITQPVEVTYIEADGKRQLVSINQEAKKGEEEEKHSSILLPLLFLSFTFCLLIVRFCLCARFSSWWVNTNR